jgi:hypothetical protein
VLPQDVNAVDAEAIVRTPPLGRFFIGEENGTSILEVAYDGRVLTRFVPAGTTSQYTTPPAPLAPADYAVTDSLPGILVRRRLNRGIESLAVSLDYRYLYALLQSPLDNPGSSARDSRNLRLFKLRLTLGLHGSTLEPVAEYVYLMAPVSRFQALGVSDAARQRDLRVSEMVHLRNERFLVIERTDQATIVFEIDLAGATDILGTKWDDPATSPTLEETADLGPKGAKIKTVGKEERLVASSLSGASPQFPPKLEGMALTPDGRLVLINDDDFGITDLETQVTIVEAF